VGMSVSRALALCPQARTVLFPSHRYQRMLRSIMDSLLHFSQWIEADRRSIQTAIFYMDLGKIRPREGWEIARSIIDRLRVEHSFTASVGLAANKFTANAAACEADSGGVRLVPLGEEKTHLAPFPVALLRLDKEIARRLNLFGIRTLGQLATLPRPALIAQFGKAGGTLHRLASGEDQRRVAKYEPEVIEKAERLFEPPVDNRIILENNLSRMLAERAAHLQHSNLNCRKLTILLHLEDRACLEADTRLHQPMNTAGDLYRIGLSLLNQLKPACGITALQVQLSDLKPVMPRQLSLFEELERNDLRESVVDVAERYVDAYFYTATMNKSPSLIAEARFHLDQVQVA
jgi:DNA polymerase-4